MFFRKKSNHYEVVYKSAYRAFFVLCMRYCTSKEDAEEAFNDGMVKYFAFEKKNKVKEKTRYALIKKILINTCIDRTRKHKMVFSEIDKNFVEEYGIEGEVEYNQLKEELLIVIQELPPMTRLVFNLYIFEGQTHKQIAKHLSISENTSSWHLHQGKKKALSLFYQEPIKNSLNG